MILISTHRKLVSRQASILCLAALILTFASAISAEAKGTKKPRGPIVPWKEVPAAAQSTIQTAVAGGKVEDTEKVISNGATIYCAEVKGTDGKWSKVYTTEAGALMKVE